MNIQWHTHSIHVGGVYSLLSMKRLRFLLHWRTFCTGYKVTHIIVTGTWFRNIITETVRSVPQQIQSRTFPTESFSALTAPADFFFRTVNNLIWIATVVRRNFALSSIYLVGFSPLLPVAWLVWHSPVSAFITSSKGGFVFIAVFVCQRSPSARLSTGLSNNCTVSWSAARLHFHGHAAKNHPKSHVCSTWLFLFNT